MLRTLVDHINTDGTGFQNQENERNLEKMEQHWQQRKMWGGWRCYRSKQQALTIAFLHEFKGLTKFKAQTNIVATRFQLSPTVIYLLYSFPILTFCQSPDTDATMPSPIAANTRAAPNPPTPDGVAPRPVCHCPRSRCFGRNWKRCPGSERMRIGIGNSLPTSIVYPSRLPKHCRRD